ncbi:hypothetical protein G4B88_024557, partial [Cannabis sativa]
MIRKFPNKPNIPLKVNLKLQSQLQCNLLDKISTTFSGLNLKKLMSTGASVDFDNPLGAALQLCLTRSKVVFMSI